MNALFFQTQSIRAATHSQANRKSVVGEALEQRQLLAGDLGVDPTVAAATVAVYGDANGDGRFNSADLARVFQRGEYEDAVSGNSNWETGDFDGDGEFTSADLVSAFQQLDGEFQLAAHGDFASIDAPLRVMTYNVQMFPDAFNTISFGSANERCCIDHRSEQIAREVLENEIDIVAFQELFDHGVLGSQEEELITPIMEGWFGPDWRTLRPSTLRSVPTTTD